MGLFIYMPEIIPTSQQSIFKRISNLWGFLIGSREEFPLEARIFHSISAGVVLLLGFDAPYDFFAGLYVSAVTCILLLIFFGIEYYGSRFKHRTHSNFIFALTGILVFSVNYFSNAGIQGSTDLVWPGYFLLLLTISPYRQHLMWTLVYIFAFFILHWVEFRHPELVKHPFNGAAGEFIDRVTAFPLPVIGIAIIIGFIRRSYDKERAIVEQNATTIDNRNAQILYQKEELEKNDAEKNKLLSILSHDLRAPFNNIQNYLRFIHETDFDSSERLMLEKELLKSTDQTMELLSNLLFWSRSQMEGIEVHLAAINLFDPLKTTIEIEKTLAENKNILLSYDIDNQITVTADADMLQLVVRNLVNNAIKFTAAGGKIDISAQLLADKCRLSVTDNGKGIDPGQRANLFSMTSRSTFGTNNEKGVGLGLPLCKEFMERQGGSIGFESALGRGSTFYILIPAAIKY
jgi:signal transduction histidine kinase